MLALLAYLDLAALSEIPVEDAAKQFATIYETNVFAVVTVNNAFLPLLRKAPAARIVNISSTLASFTRIKPVSAYAAYSSSKTALNALTSHYAAELKDTPVKVNSVCPGFCATGLNNHRGTKSASEGAVIAVTMATLPADSPLEATLMTMVPFHGEVPRGPIAVCSKTKVSLKT